MAQVAETFEELQDSVADVLSGLDVDTSVAFGELSLLVDVADITAALSKLKNDMQTQFVNLIDISGVDYPGREKRFDVVYHLLSPKLNQRVRLRVQTDEETPVPSACDVFPGANWYERETYDMYGILFSGHPDLRRLLTDYGFDGHPMRKDFPLTGFYEVRYDDEVKRVVYEPVNLRQEFRDFDFLSPWEGAEYVLPGDEKAKEQ
ncbi:MAG: NADH-quinone oxidoreductase subunit C [Pseudomonadota bacterium]